MILFIDKRIKSLLINNDLDNKTIGIYLAVNEEYPKHVIFDELEIVPEFKHMHYKMQIYSYKLNKYSLEIKIHQDDYSDELDYVRFEIHYDGKYLNGYPVTASIGEKAMDNILKEFKERLINLIINNNQNN